jgi:Uma2 family endonuclease
VCYLPSVAQPAEDRRKQLYNSYLVVPEHLHAEIVRGTLHVMPRPSPRHASASSVLGGRLNGPFQLGEGGPGGWWILFEPEVHLVPEEPVVPDLAGWRVETMPELPDTAFITAAPDWVCEVLSRSTEKLDRDEKLPLYAEHGVGQVWLVDPLARTLEAYTLGESGRWREVRHYRADERARIAPFEAIELDLSLLWAGPRRA